MLPEEGCVVTCGGAGHDLAAVVQGGSQRDRSRLRLGPPNAGLPSRLEDHHRVAWKRRGPQRDAMKPSEFNRQDQS